jgi:hypothetical protein
MEANEAKNQSWWKLLPVSKQPISLVLLP